MADEIDTLLNAFGITPEALLVIIVIVVLVMLATILIVAARPVADIYPYFYPNAKIRARKGRLLTEDNMSEISDVDDVNGVSTYLRGFPDYVPYLDEYPIDKALEVNLADTYKLLSNVAPGQIQKPFKVMAKKVDITNIKSLISAKDVGYNAEQTKELLIPAGSLYDLLVSLADAETVSDVLTQLDGTEYAPVLEDALPRYEQNKMVLELESAFDNYYLETLLASTEVSSEENTLILNNYVGTQVDLALLKTIVRAKKDGLGYNDISPYILKNGYQLREWKLKDLMEASDVNNIVSYLEGTKYLTFLSEALDEYNNTGSTVLFEKALDIQLIESAKSLATVKPLGISPIIGFLSKKETEIRNLKIISRAKKEPDYPVSKIKELLV